MPYDVPGLRCLPDYVTPDEAESLLAQIDASGWRATLKRRVQHYGYEYDYKAKAVREEMWLGPLPNWAASLAERLHADGLIHAVPDQVIVNEYQPGQGISAHVDCVPCFGETVISLSLGSACVMHFSRITDALSVPVLLEPCTVLAMTGESRYLWKHGIAPRKVDVYKRRILRRGRRVSVTFRTVLVARGEVSGPAYVRPRAALYW